MNWEKPQQQPKPRFCRSFLDLCMAMKDKVTAQCHSVDNKPYTGHIRSVTDEGSPDCWLVKMLIGTEFKEFCVRTI